MKRILFILVLLPALAMSQGNVPISAMPPITGNPTTWKLPVVIPSGTSSSNYSNRLASASDFINRAYHTGTQAKNTVTGLQATLDSIVAAFGGYATTSALAGKQNTLVSGTSIKTINGINLLGSGDITIAGGGGGGAVSSLTTSGTSGPATLSGGVLNIPNYTVSGGGSFDTTSTSTKNQLTGYINDHSPSATIAFAGTDFQMYNGQYYLKGSYYSPTVTNGNGNIVPTLQTGSKNRKGVIIVTITASTGVSDGTDLAVVSFGGETYSSAPSVSITSEQYFPGFKVSNATTTGWTLDVSTAGTMNAGTYRFHYQVEQVQ